MTPRQRAKVNRLHRQGYTHAKIAELTGVTRHEVGEYLRGKAPKPKPVPRCRRGREEREANAVAELRREGCSEAAIAACFPGVVR